MYKVFEIGADWFEVEKKLKQAAQEGYELVETVQGHAGHYTRDGEYLTGSWQPSMIILRMRFSTIDAILSLIDQLSDSGRQALIDQLPDYIIDPICERCDGPQDEGDDDDHLEYHPHNETLF